MNEELKNKLRIAVRNLQYAKEELNNAKNVLNKSILLNNETFKSDDISNLNQSLNVQIYNIENRIISEINE